MAKTKIGILGTGDVGRTLGAGLCALGHEVKIGSREPASEKLREWKARAGPLASTGTFAEAAASGDLLVLATLWTGTENALRLAGAGALAGKPLIDTTNPLDFSSGAPRLSLGHTDSAGEQVQRWAPQARVVKAFNTVGNAHMVKPQFPGGPPDMFLCGNDEPAKAAVSALCGELGWPTVDLGGIEMSRYLEPLAMVWIVHYFRTKSGNHALKLLRK
ncbi:MAG: NADPH-dependent F420 reductase [Deltaproteobacteria bacterium]|nr:NADPH-dependent F420 reductase [Deltaproteobacteria bacterium]